MLIFSEGVPGSGKSYDAVKEHILPALKKGRPVFARINGLDHERIAAHLQIPVEKVRANLHLVAPEQVRARFIAEQQPDATWLPAKEFRNALIVIDEAHEFYVGGTKDPLPPQVEQFFAMHRHGGLDILIMTQFYKRIHIAIRSRIERKNSFQKLSALGKKGESAYRVTFWQTIAPDRYEKVGGETRTYDPAIFPLYSGVAEPDVQTEVYSAGRTSVWKAMKWRALFIIPIGAYAIWFLLDFFAGGGEKLVKKNKVGTPAPIAAGQYQAQASQPTPAEQKAAAKEAKLAKLTPEQRYVWQLSEAHRVRLAAMIGQGSKALGLVEWVDSSQRVQERLTLQQLRDLGVDVTVHVYGVRLDAGGERLIATAWPMNMPLREEQPRLYDTSGGLRPNGEQSEPFAAGFPTTTNTTQTATEQQHGYGGFRP